jgi:hypothetical protein
MIEGGLAALAGAAVLIDRVTLFGRSPSFAWLFFFINSSLHFLTAEPVRSSDFFQRVDTPTLSTAFEDRTATNPGSPNVPASADDYDLHV